ncbi:MAG: YncE family protein, partial [Anaerolineae bacterium]
MTQSNQHEFTRRIKTASGKLFFLGLVLFSGMTFATSFSNSSAQESENGWVHCADEGQTCSAPGGTIPSAVVVRFGNGDGYSYAENIKSAISCSPASFDPLPSTAAKTCEYWSGDNLPSFAQTPYFPNQSSQISCQDESEQNNLWVVNPDNHSVSVIDTDLEPGSQHVILQSQRELYLNFRTPTSVTQIANYYAVTFRDDDKVVFYDGTTTTPVFTIDTGHGSQPVASFSEESEATLFVALFGSSARATVNLSSRRISHRWPVGPMPRAMALYGERLLVTRFISEPSHGEVYDIDVSGNPALVRTIEINKVRVNDGLSHGSGVPNFLSSIVINQDGTEAYVTAVKSNID